MSDVSKGRMALISAAAMLFMMAVVGMAQYLVSGRLSTGTMVAISIPTGILLGRNLARSKSS